MKSAIVGVLSVLGVLCLLVAGTALVPEASDFVWRLTGVRIGMGVVESELGADPALQGFGDPAPSPPPARAPVPVTPASPPAPVRDVANSVAVQGGQVSGAVTQSGPKAEGSGDVDDGRVYVQSAAWMQQRDAKVTLPSGSVLTLPVQLTLPVGVHTLVFSGVGYGHVRCEVRVRPFARLELTYRGRFCEAESQE
jgi:hypothetical protein